MAFGERIIGMDYGLKRVGFSLSDPLKITAGPKGLEERPKGMSLEAFETALLEKLNEFLQEYEIERVVLGLPKNMNGSEGPMAEKVHHFKDFLEENLSVPISTWDERLTSMQAEKEMIRADLSRKKRKKKIDVMAAQLMLQSYLDASSRST